MTCFNCGEFHHMSKCNQVRATLPVFLVYPLSQPINPFRVASNRRKYQDEHGAIGTDKRSKLTCALVLMCTCVCCTCLAAACCP